MVLLQADGLVKSFGEVPVLRGVDLAVDAHQAVCLIGASGSGKSTLLRCLNLLERVDDGTVWFAGRDVTDPRVDADAVRRQIGMVFQAYNLFPHRSVLDNVMLAPRLLSVASRRAAREEALSLLGRFGLADKAQAYPDSLSGGQQQRVAIVRALAMHPQVLLLDEVTSALDPLLVGEVLAVIAELTDTGMTVVMATHEMSFARDVADTVVFLDGGVVVEEGPAAQVLDAPTHPRTAQFLARFRAR
jgi:polar amino acid transport system ATP-binding protein